MYFNTTFVSSRITLKHIGVANKNLTILKIKVKEKFWKK